MPYVRPDWKAKQREYRKEMRALGRCVACVARAVPGLTFCELHRERARQASAALQAKRANWGQCRECGVETATGKTRCVPCSKRNHGSSVKTGFRKGVFAAARLVQESGDLELAAAIMALIKLT